jgi:hypothetical protein
MESILQQSFESFELIVVDDGSTDGTAEVLRGYRDPRVRLLKNEGQHGVVQALTVGMGAARGEYVARMDSDDVSHRERLATQVAFLDRERAVALVGSCANAIDEAGVVGGVIRVPTGSAEIHRLLPKRNTFIHPSVLFRRQAVLELGGYQAVRPGAGMAQDYHLWLRLEERYPLANLAEVLLDYRVHAGQVSTQNLIGQLECADLARRMAAKRRRAQGIPWTTERELGWLGRLRGEPGSLAADCLHYHDHFVAIGKEELARRLAWRAVLASPLSRSAWTRAGREARRRMLEAGALQVLREWLAGRS